MTTDLAAPDLSAVESVVSVYCVRTARDVGVLDLAAEMQRKRALINRLELDFARDAARFDTIYDDQQFANPGPVSWMREHCHMTSHAAASAVCIGEKAERLQMSCAALVEGGIGFAHLGLMASTAEAIDRSPTASALFDETRLLAKAHRLTVQCFRTECAHLRHAADRAAFLAEQVLDREWRSLRVRALSCGGIELTGYLDAEGGAVVRTALEPLAARAGSDDERSREQRCADALVELCAHRLDTGLVPQRASQRTHVQVTSTLETLLGLVGSPAGEMEYADVIAGATVQRVACDATITRVLLGAGSAVVDVGRSARVVPGATRRALNVRDGGCRWPGCDRSASWTAAHHVVHWAHGGATDLDNLVLLCGRHHWSVHEGGWQLVRDGDRLLTVPPVRDDDAWHWSPALPDEPALAEAPAVAEAEAADERFPGGVLRE